jgi:hypothetical protein
LVGAIISSIAFLDNSLTFGKLSMTTLYDELTLALLPKFQIRTHHVNPRPNEIVNIFHF